MTNDDVLFLASSLPKVDAPEMDPDFNYAVAHNIRQAEAIAEDIRKAIEPHSDYEEYDKQATKLREKFAEKDSEGDPKKTFTPTPVGVQVSYKIPGAENPDSAFNKALDKCKTEHKAAIEKRKTQLEFLGKENKDIHLMMVDMSLHPKGLSRIAADAVFLMTIKPDKK